jgi:hypothetical protein
VSDFNLPGIDWEERKALGGRDHQFLLVYDEAGLI